MQGGGSAPVPRDEMRNTRDNSPLFDEQLPAARVAYEVPLIAMGNSVWPLGLVVGCVTWAVVTWISESPPISDFGAEPGSLAIEGSNVHNRRRHPFFFHSDDSSGRVVVVNLFYTGYCSSSLGIKPAIQQ